MEEKTITVEDLSIAIEGYRSNLPTIEAMPKVKKALGGLGYSPEARKLAGEILYPHTDTIERFLESRGVRTSWKTIDEQITVAQRYVDGGYWDPGLYSPDDEAVIFADGEWVRNSPDIDIGPRWIALK